MGKTDYLDKKSTVRSDFEIRAAIEHYEYLEAIGIHEAGNMAHVLRWTLGKDFNDEQTN